MYLLLSMRTKKAQRSTVSPKCCFLTRIQLIEGKDWLKVCLGDLPWNNILQYLRPVTSGYRTECVSYWFFGKKKKRKKKFKRQIDRNVVAHQSEGLGKAILVHDHLDLLIIFPKDVHQNFILILNHKEWHSNTFLVSNRHGWFQRPHIRRTVLKGVISCPVALALYCTKEVTIFIGSKKTITGNQTVFDNEGLGSSRSTPWLCTAAPCSRHYKHRFISTDKKLWWHIITISINCMYVGIKWSNQCAVTHSWKL